MNKDFLPMTREELSARGWEQPDFVYISGAACWRPGATRWG